MMAHVRTNVRAVSATLSGLALAGVLNAPARGADLYSNARLADLSNPGIATGPRTTSGVLAPSGKLWSELQGVSTFSANAIAGFAGHDASSGYRFADDFAVTGTWSINEIVIYAYASDPTSVSPFAGLNLRIWSGAPEMPTSTLRFGDVFTNRLTSATPTNILRIFSTQAIIGTSLAALPTTDRVVWELRAAISPPLAARSGTLWLDWQIMTSTPQIAAFAPSVTVLDRRTRVGGSPSNARQLRLSGAPVIADTWVPLVDSGKPSTAVDVAQDLPFLVRGDALQGACSPADIATDDGIPLINATAQSSNNGITEGDYNLFFAGFFDALPFCDIANDDGSPLPPFGDARSNNAVTEGDYNLFFALFFNGCAL